MKKPAAREFEFVASDDSIDCVQERVPTSAWRLERFRKNPVVLFSHDHSKPIATATRVWIDGDKLMARIRFPEPGIDELSDDVHNKIASGLIKGMSVGFRAHKTHIEGDVRVIDEAELMELSVVTVGCVAGALRVASAKPRTSKAELRELVREAVAKKLPKPKPRISRKVALERIERGIRDELYQKAIAELCEQSGALDEDGLRLRADASPDFAKALATVMSRIRTAGDVMVKKIEARL